jgi:hypothetical protein
VLREELDQLWKYATPRGVANFLWGWVKALRWQRLPEMEKLGRFLVEHYEGIAAYCHHHVRFGVVESINTTIKAVLRRARGIRDEAMLLLKLKWATAHPIRSSRDLSRFVDGGSDVPMKSHASPSREASVHILGDANCSKAAIPPFQFKRHPNSRTAHHHTPERAIPGCADT